LDRATAAATNQPKEPPTKDHRQRCTRNTNQRNHQQRAIDNAAPIESTVSSDGSHQDQQTAVILQDKDNTDKGINA
jgi:hypothetical protein